MKRLATLAAFLVGALAFTGCIQFHSDTVIEDDGSGTATMTLSVSAEVAEALREMAAMDPDQAADMDFPAFEDIDGDEIRKAAKGHGVKMTKFDKNEADGRQALDIELEFEDLKGLSYVMGKVMGGQPGEGPGIFDAGDGNFVLRPTTYDFPAEPVEEAEEEETVAPPAEPTPEQMQKQMALMGTLMSSLAELDVSLRITVPGDIIESNAPTVEGRTSIWAVNQTNVMQQDQNMDPEIVFSGKGLKIKPLTE